MDPRFPPALVVSGTDTDVGKSLVAAILVKGLKACYWKPVQSGLTEATDRERIISLTGMPPKDAWPEAYRLSQPLSPHLSARLDGVTIDLAKLALPPLPPDRHVIIEGAGGLMVPLNQQDLLLDLLALWRLPVLLVVRSGLGTINHSLLSIQALRQRGIPLFGLVMNGPPNPGNFEALSHFGKIQVLAQIPPLEDLSPESLQAVFQNAFS